MRNQYSERVRRGGGRYGVRTCGLLYVLCADTDEYLLHLVLCLGRALQYYRVASGITISDIHFEEEEGEIDGGRDGKTFQTQDINIMDSPHSYFSIFLGIFSEWY